MIGCEIVGVGGVDVIGSGVVSDCGAGPGCGVELLFGSIIILPFYDACDYYNIFSVV